MCLDTGVNVYLVLGFRGSSTDLLGFLGCRTVQRNVDILLHLQQVLDPLGP